MLLQETARAYHDAGLQVLPVVHGEKRPIKAWKEYTTRPQTAEEVSSLFPEGQSRNIAIIGGEVSSNFFALDFDNRKTFVRLVESSPALARIASTSPLVNTARGVHVYLKAPVPIRSTKHTDLALDIKGEGGYVVAPPSLHRSGQLYLFDDGWKMIQEIPLDALPFLSLEPYSCAPSVENLAPREYSDIYQGGGFYGLGNHAASVLAGKAPKGIRSEEEARIVFTCARNGWTFAQVAELFERHAKRETHFREHATPWKYLRHSYETAIEKLRTNRREVDRRLDALAEAFTHYPFASRTALTDRAVLESVLMIARRSGRLVVGLSVREIAELAGIGITTASRSLARLPLERHGITASGGLVFKLPEAKSLPQLPHLYPSKTVEECVILTKHGVASDAERRGAIGKNGVLILNALREERALDVQEIAKASGVAWRTVYRKLERLIDCAVVVKSGKSYRLARKIDARLLEEIAEHFGTKGSREKQRRQHEEERLVYRARLLPKG